MTSYRLPFDLIPQLYHTVEISPEVTSAMIEGEDGEKIAIEKIAKAWTKRADEAVSKNLPEPVFGIEIIRRYGFTASEREKLADTATQEREQMVKILSLRKKIVGETGKTTAEVQAKMLDLESGGELDWLEPYMEDLMGLQAGNNPKPYDGLATTLYIRRAIPDWVEADTKALHPRIRQELTDFDQLENSDEEPPKKSEP
jgi:hypothetical protein